MNADELILTNVPVPCEMLAVREAEGGMGSGGREAGALWEFSVFSTQFLCEPKTVVKIKSLKNKIARKSWRDAC